MFRAKRSDRIKLLYWDGSGLVLYAKRLEQGGFRWPKIADGVMRMTPVQFADELHAVRLRHIKIRHDEFDGLGLENFQRRFRAGGGMRLPATFAQRAKRIGDRGEIIRLVVHDQNAAFAVQFFFGGH